MKGGERCEAKRETDWRSPLLDLCDGEPYVLLLFPKNGRGRKVTSTRLH